MGHSQIDKTQITKTQYKMMRFCGSCNNMLYPRENKQKNGLEYACKPPCVYVEKNITNSLVFENKLVMNSATRLEVIPSEVNKDPTLARSETVTCAKCLNKRAAEQTQKSTAFVLVFVCCKCGHKWLDDQTISNVK